MNAARVLLPLALTSVIIMIFGVDYASAQQKKVAVLELYNRAGITNEEADYLTELVRGAASRTLPVQAFTIMTKENIYELLPPGTDLNRCTTAECEVEVGRIIGADYIVTGEILKFAGEYRVLIKAHHSFSGAYLGEQTVKGRTLTDLENAIKGEVAALLNYIRSHVGLPKGPTIPQTPEGKIGETPTGGWEVPSVDETVVEFRSDPTGAIVMVDGKLLCQTTPCSKQLSVGSASVSMQKEKYLPKESVVDIKKGMQPIVWRLEPNFGWLTVESVPSGLTVKINGKDAGKTPIKDKELDPGPYEVLVSDPRYYDSGERINLARGERRTVSVTLTAKEGAIKVSAVDPDGNALTGDVYVDGKKVGIAPGTFKTIVGMHDVEVKTAKGSWSGKVDVKEKQVSDVSAKVSGLTKPKTEAGRGNEWVLIPAGSFMMGCAPSDSACGDDEKPYHEVYLDAYYIQKHEVTVAEYRECVNAGACTQPRSKSDDKYCNWGYSDRDNHPVNCVDWNQAKSYCEWIGGRLPTEAEWEKAARGTDGRIYPWGNSFDCHKGNFDDEKVLNDYVVPGGPNCDGYQSTSPVCSFPSGNSPYGLCDMSGNVWEWVNDWYNENYYSSSPKNNPQGPSSGGVRVLRGGSWVAYPQYFRASNRDWYEPGLWLTDVGFRCSLGALGN